MEKVDCENIIAIIESRQKSVKRQEGFDQDSYLQGYYQGLEDLRCFYIKELTKE